MPKQQHVGTRAEKFRLAVAVVTLAVSVTFISSVDRSSSSIPTPTQTTDQCILHYTHFHLLFTIPPLALLFFLTAPFLTSLDWYKLYLLPLIAFVWTTPWDNELVRKQAWWYPSSCVLARIGYVPVEEYAFFILQSLMTTLLTILITRWSTPRLSKPHAAASLLPFLSVSLMVLGLHSLLAHEDGQGSRYYLSMITWWASVPLTLLWWGTAQSWAGVIRNGQARVWLLCVALPTIYLCSADIYALRRGTWHISESRSLQLFVVPELPIEEAIFFLATNLILVSACFAFDRVVWQKRSEDVARGEEFATAPPLSPNYFTMTWVTVKEVWQTFIHLDVRSEKMKDALEMEKHRDYSLQILARASKSFSTAATLLPWDLRVDLGSLYALARTMDDFVDQPFTNSEEGFEDRAHQRITLLRLIARLAFDTDASSHKYVQEKLSDALQQYKSSGEDLTLQQEKDLLTSTLSASLLRHIVPTRLWNDLIDGYRSDSIPSGPHFTTFEEQADYAQSVAGAVGEMCVRVVLARVGILIARDYVVPRDVKREALVSQRMQTDTPLQESQVKRAQHSPRLEAKTVELILRDSRRMGVSLQLVNIARDIVKDAEELGRCYLVTGCDDNAGIRRALCGNSLDDEEEEGVLSSDAQSEEREVADMVAPLIKMNKDMVFLQKVYLLDVADQIYRSSIHSIDLIPCKAAQTGLRVACAVYANIGNIIRRQGPQRCMERSKASSIERLWVAVKAVYFSAA